MLPYIPEFDTVFIPDKPANPVSQLVQLSYVLPQEHLHLLPKPLYKKLILDYRHWYGVDFDFVWSFCKYFWEAHVLLPEIDISKLEKVVDEAMSEME